VMINVNLALHAANTFGSNLTAARRMAMLYGGCDPLGRQKFSETFVPESASSTVPLSRPCCPLATVFLRVWTVITHLGSLLRVEQVREVWRVEPPALVADTSYGLHTATAWELTLSSQAAHDVRKKGERKSRQI